ncbi:hypothetical protein [Prescottella equi]|uniref:hypothetical protein n=1 Tax=Rhodococcus hoagii TaxID=43767 RepID=UPI00131ADE4F|nr:hypothetical protein [Prescottella equi]
MQTDEARAAVQEWAARATFHDPHDPEMLMCLDKGDIVSRYLLLLHQRDHERRSTAEHHAAELRRLRETVAAAGRWWDHCRSLRRRGRKTANLTDMETN